MIKDIKKEKDQMIFSSKSREELDNYKPGLKPEDGMPEAKEIEHSEYLKRIQEPDAVLVCVTLPIPGFGDNIKDTCDDCGETIYYRPYNKIATKKVCTTCADNIE